MKFRKVLLWSVILLAIIKSIIFYVYGSSEFLWGWVIYSILIIHWVHAYLVGWEMLSPPNFNYKNGKNEIARGFLVGCAIVPFVYLLVFEW